MKMRIKSRRSSPVWRFGSSRRGATVTLAAFLLAVLVGMLAFGIDIGYATASRSELQRTADSAALAGGWQLLEGIANAETMSSVSTKINNAVVNYAHENPLGGKPAKVGGEGETQDVTVGYFDWSTNKWTGAVSDMNTANAVRVRIRRNEEINGSVPLFFGPIFGRKSLDMQVNAVAAMTARIGGFDIISPECENVMLMPFAMDEPTWDAMMKGQAGNDDYSYNELTGVLTKGKSDGVREVNLYPDAEATGAPGNRGTVDIGGLNNSTSDIERQILHGISYDDMQALKATGRSLELDSKGFLYLQGDTGISAGVKEEVAAIVNEVRCIPIFRDVTLNGNSAEFQIIGWEGVRILEVRLTGPMNQKRLIVQPAKMVMHGAIPSSTARVSSFAFTPVVLVQ
jgi:Flp pilus assembly protein TadG